ncbi:MAG TPA: hypothetical protein VHA56_06760 [Mucilaginibacter sp.]|nr:hypothetical protein [Mucilaginibacter sp.]
MGLLGFFKRNKEAPFDAVNEKDIRVVLQHGILLEDSQVFLRWGESIDLIGSKTDILKKLFADRVVYYYGEHLVLNGLKLNLSGTHWYNEVDGDQKTFRFIEFSCEGDQNVLNEFTFIKDHLAEQFGNSLVREGDEQVNYLEWNISGVKISLNLFEKYGVNKLRFEMRKF